MKKLYILLFLITGVFQLHAQNTSLSYSRVLLVSTVQTVPAGHVWKLESAAPAYGPRTTTSGYGSFPTLGNDYVIVINRTNLNITRPITSSPGASSAYGSTPNAIVTAINYEMFPMWLPAGTTLAASTGVSYISVIEFKENP